MARNRSVEPQTLNSYNRNLIPINESGYRQNTKFVNLTCKFQLSQWNLASLHNFHILDHFNATKAKEEKKRKGRRNGKDGRRREDDVTRNCLLYLYLKIVLSLRIANLKSCILHCVTIGKKWSTVFKLYAKTCLYFFLFFLVMAGIL